jgi:putative membrane protein
MSIRRLVQVAGALAFGMGAIIPTARAQGKDDVKADAKWVREVAADNLLEVDLGKVGQKRATNATVKQFADRMVTDHTKAQDELVSLATSHGLPLKPELGPRHEQKLDLAQKAPHKNFDRDYIRSMIEDHNADISYFENEGEHAHSAPVRDYAKKYLPVLQDHLKEAKRIAGEIGVDTTLAHHAQKTTAHKTTTRK